MKIFKSKDTGKDANGNFAFGLTRLFKVPHKYSVGELSCLAELKDFAALRKTAKMLESGSPPRAHRRGS